MTHDDMTAATIEGVPLRIVVFFVFGAVRLSVFIWYRFWI